MSSRDRYQSSLRHDLLKLLAAMAAAGAALLSPARSLAFWNVGVGDAIRDRQLVTLDGSSQLLLGQARVTVFVFCRPEHDRSLQTLRELAQLEREFAGRPVRFVAVISDSYSPRAVRAMMREAGARMEVLIDQGDALAGELGVDTRPAVAIADESHRLAAYQHFLSVNMTSTLEAQIAEVLERRRGLAREDGPNEVDGPRAVLASTSGGPQ